MGFLIEQFRTQLESLEQRQRDAVVKQAANFVGPAMEPGSDFHCPLEETSTVSELCQKLEWLVTEAEMGEEDLVFGLLLYMHGIFSMCGKLEKRKKHGASAGKCWRSHTESGCHCGRVARSIAKILKKLAVCVPEDPAAPPTENEDQTEPDSAPVGPASSLRGDPDSAP